MWIWNGTGELFISSDFYCITPVAVLVLKVLKGKEMLHVSEVAMCVLTSVGVLACIQALDIFVTNLVPRLSEYFFWYGSAFP